jgi:hypothetical protein
MNLPCQTFKSRIGERHKRTTFVLKRQTLKWHYYTPGLLKQPTRERKWKRHKFKKKSELYITFHKDHS